MQTAEEIGCAVEVPQNITEEIIELINGSDDWASANDAQATRASQSLGDIGEIQLVSASTQQDSKEFVDSSETLGNAGR